MKKILLNNIIYLSCYVLISIISYYQYTYFLSFTGGTKDIGGYVRCFVLVLVIGRFFYFIGKKLLRPVSGNAGKIASIILSPIVFYLLYIMYILPATHDYLKSFFEFFAWSIPFRCFTRYGPLFAPLILLLITYVGMTASGKKLTNYFKNNIKGLGSVALLFVLLIIVCLMFNLYFGNYLAKGEYKSGGDYWKYCFILFENGVLVEYITAGETWFLKPLEVDSIKITRVGQEEIDYFRDFIDNQFELEDEMSAEDLWLYMDTLAVDFNGKKQSVLLSGAYVDSVDKLFADCFGIEVPKRERMIF